jgi:hypothetical protein
MHSFMLYSLPATLFYTQIFTINILHNIYIYFFSLLHDSAMNFGHLQGATRLFDVYSV